MTDAAREEAEREYAHVGVTGYRELMIAGFERGASWQASQPITDAEVLAALNTWHEYDPPMPREFWHEVLIEDMRAALEAARAVEVR